MELLDDSLKSTDQYSFQMLSLHNHCTFIQNYEWNLFFKAFTMPGFFAWSSFWDLRLLLPGIVSSLILLWRSSSLYLCKYGLCRSGKHFPLSPSTACTSAMRALENQSRILRSSYAVFISLQLEDDWSWKLRGKVRALYSRSVQCETDPCDHESSWLHSLAKPQSSSHGPFLRSQSPICVLICINASGGKVWASLKSTVMV